MNHTIIKEMLGYNIGFMILIKQPYPRLQNRVLSLLIHIVGFQWCWIRCSRVSWWWCRKNFCCNDWMNIVASAHGYQLVSKLNHDAIFIILSISMKEKESINAKCIVNECYLRSRNWFWTCCTHCWGLQMSHSSKISFYRISNIFWGYT